jgi:DNA anti-recombination protein RmuC
MEAMRESWTDDRLDDLNSKVDALRLEMKTEFRTVRGEMDRRFDRVDERFDKMDERFDKRFEKIDARFERMDLRMDERFERMDERLHQIYQTMLGFCGAALAALLGFIATQI